MAATKRNAGLTSGVPRKTLNDEELVRDEMVNQPPLRSSVLDLTKRVAVILPENARL